MLLAVIHTWPLADAPSNWSRVDGDGGMNTWAVNWVAHALLNDPGRLFDANIFHPQKLTLAYSEAMLVQSLFAVPVVAVGGSPVLAYNVAVVTSLAITGWLFCLLVARWTGSWAAGYAAGSLAAFNAFTLVNFTHLQFLQAGFVAVMLYALDRLITLGRWRDSFTLGIAFALQAMASLYLMVFSVFMLIFALLARGIEVMGRARTAVTRLAAAAAVALLLLAPYLAPYWQLQQTMDFSRGADEAESASWTNYFATGARLHFENWSRPFASTATSYTFPGIAALALTAVAFSDRALRRDPRVRMCAVAAVGCLAISFVPALPFYPAIHDAIPIFSGVRAVHRIGQVMLLMMAVMAGFGVAALALRWQSRWWPAVAIVLMVAVNGEALRAPMGFIWFDGVPAAYDRLAEERNAVIVEIPFPMPQQWFLNAGYMVNSTRHWRPILNGYSSYRPPSYYEAYDRMRAFPSDESLLWLHDQGVTHVVLHRRDWHGPGAGSDNPFEGVASLDAIVKTGDMVIYRFMGH